MRWRLLLLWQIVTFAANDNDIETKLQLKLQLQIQRERVQDAEVDAEAVADADRNEDCARHGCFGTFPRAAANGTV